MANITLPNLQTLFPLTPSVMLTPYPALFEKLLPVYEINTNQRLAMFLSQVGWESGGFRFTEGNFNFSATGLMKVFPKYFPDLTTAKQYEHQPEKIVLLVYSNRMGNGPASTGDAWTYRERGLIQLCGKDNYLAYANDKKMTVDQAIAYLETTEGAVDVAGWFWTRGKLNTLADKGDIAGATKIINGGYTGLAGRELLYKTALIVLNPPSMLKFLINKFTRK